MDDKKGLKDEAKSKVEKSRRGKKPGSKKTGGRKKGTINKHTLWLRDELNNVGMSWGKEFKLALDRADYQKAQILADLLPYLNPKLKDREAESPSIETPKDNELKTLTDENLLKLVKEQSK